MNIHTIQLENWKKFRKPVQINLKEGLNILYGPNESGKTTLIDSVITTFYSKHTSNSQKIKSLKPWGTSLHPRSNISFTKNGQKYRITKGFQDRKSLLEKMDQGSWMQIAEGDKADKQLIELVGGQMPTRGDTRPEYWGLGQTLWMVQGTPIIQEELNHETRSSMQKMVGATIESEEEKNVLKNINSRFLENFSPKKKELKKKSQLGTLKEEIIKLKNELSLSQANIMKKETLMRTLEDNKILFEKNKSSLEAAKNEKSQLAQGVDEAYQHQRNREKLEREVQELETEYLTTRERLDEIIRGQTEIDKIIKSSDEINLQLDPLKSESENLNHKMEDDTSAIRNLDQQLSTHMGEKRIVGIAHTAVMDEQALDEKKNQLNEIIEIKDDLKITKEKYDPILVPDDKEFAKIEGLSQDIHDAQTSLNAMGLNIKATTHNKISGNIFLDRENASFYLDGESATWTAHQSLKIVIDGVGVIEVTSGSQDVQEMKERLENFKNQYQELIAPFPQADLPQLKSLMNQKESLKKDIEWLQSQLNKKSKKGEDELLKEIKSLENRIKSNWDKIPAGSAYKECESKDKIRVREELSVKINLMEGVLNQLQKDRQKLNEILENDRGTIKSTADIIVELKTKLHGNNQRKEEIENRLSILTDDGLSIEEREYKLNQISLKIEQKERVLTVYQDELEEKEIRPRKAFDGLKSKVERLDDEIRRQEINRAGMERELSMLMAQSTDSSVLEEKLTQLKIQEKELEIEVAAIKLLHNLTSHYQENTISKLAEPLEIRVTEDMERLLGPKYSLKFDLRMKPESVNTQGEEASLDLLSFGTQEQVWYLFRLALGNILSSEEQQLVVLDDPLVNTDPVRMHHALEILEENARNMQVVVVTCDVDKYDSLTSANFISMDEIIS
nr:AAA family ATPase [uncultured Methanobacterium sp.]